MNVLFDEINKITGKKSQRRLHFLKFDDVSQFRSQFESLNLSLFQKSWNALLLISLLLIFLVLFVAKTFELQIVKGNENLALADGNRIRIVHNPAERGLVLDRNNEILVRNIPAFSLNMSTETCVQEEKCLVLLEKFAGSVDLKLDMSRIKKDIQAGKVNILIASGITKEDLLSLEPRISEYPIFTIGVSPQRQYMYSDAFAHVIGYVGLADTLYPSIEGKTGIEQEYDNYLKGVSGGEIVQVNSSGYKINTISEKKTIPGSNIKLNVDKDLQIKAYELLKQKIEKKEATAGAVIATDPKTGGVLALVSYPSFDPNTLSEGLTSEEFNNLIQQPHYPFFNRVISATYPPASTFKLVMAAGALVEKVITDRYQIFDVGFIQIGSYIFRNWNTAGHGLVDLRRALQVSNDTYFYTVGGGYNDIAGLGIERIHNWATKFGYGKLTGIDLPGEVTGSMPDGKSRQWYLGDTYITSIGQGDILATPLQVNNTMSYYAGKNKTYVPKVTQSIDDKLIESKVLYENLTDTSVSDIIKEGLNLAVLPGGTAYPVYDIPTKHPGVELAGKTGTAEFGSAENEKTHAWFTVFGSLNDPSIVLTVFLEEGGSGSADAAPIARELLDLWFTKNK